MRPKARRPRCCWTRLTAGLDLAGFVLFSSLGRPGLMGQPPARGTTGRRPNAVLDALAAPPPGRRARARGCRWPGGLWEQGDRG